MQKPKRAFIKPSQHPTSACCQLALCKAFCGEHVQDGYSLRLHAKRSNLLEDNAAHASPAECPLGKVASAFDIKSLHVPQLKAQATAVAEILAESV